MRLDAIPCNSKSLEDGSIHRLEIMTPLPTGRKSRKAKPEPLDEAGLYAYAVRVLGSQMRTAAELTRKMRLRVEPGESGQAKIDAVLRRLVEYRYLDDRRYAAAYTRMRQENDRFGRRRVQQELSRRGVSGELINQTLDAAYGDLPEMELAQRYAERKRLQRPANDKEAARIVRSMVRGGFSMNTIFSLLKRWRVDESMLSAAESIDPEAEPERGAE